MDVRVTKYTYIKPHKKSDGVTAQRQHREREREGEREGGREKGREIERERDGGREERGGWGGEEGRE